jgi:phenylacetate-CoA ligase
MPFARLRESPAWLGFDALRALKQGPETIAARQRRRLAELVAFAREKSPYYQELYRDLPDHVVDVTRLPVTDKPKLMARYDSWATDREVTMGRVRAIADDPERTGEYLLGKYTVRTTSGTTGVPGIFVIDNHALAVDRALALRTVSAWLGIGGLAKVVARGGRMAFVAEGNGHDAASVAAARQRRGPLGRRLNTVVRVQAPLDQKVAQLNRFRPAALFSNASEARLLATEQEAGRLRIAPLLVTLSGEGLIESEYDRIARAFGARVVNWYAANECSFMTYSCREGWLHVNSDWVVLEPVDQEYLPVAPDRESHTLLISNLANRVQPVLRYDIGDRAVRRPDPCPCGIPLPAIRVQGRVSEVLYIRNVQGRLAGIPPGVFTDLGHIPGMDIFQIEQVEPTLLRLRFRVKVGANAAEVWREAQREGRRIVTEHGLENVTFERSEEPPHIAPGGKLPRVLPLRQ